MIEVPPAGWLHPDVDVRPSPISGVGLFTRSGLAVGTVVSRLGGELVSTGTLEELIALAVRGERPYVDSIAVTDDAHLLLPPGTANGRGNHSCDPNLWWVDAYTLSARRDVDAGEELTNDYATSTASETFTMTCGCGSRLCRRVVSGRDWRRPDLQRRYGRHWVPAVLARIDASVPAGSQPPVPALELELPRSLLAAARAADHPANGRRVWIAALPRIVEDLSRRWSLRVGRPFQPGGATSWVAPALTTASEPVVLKVGWRHEEALHEADGLRAWDGAGAVRLLEALVIGDTSALLLEACEPGTPLSAVLPPVEQDAVVAGLLGRLWIAPPAGSPFRPLAAMCDAWAAEFEETYGATPPSGQLDPGLARAGVELFRYLPRTADREVLLCTDLHPENVLAARREPWLAIDPKPYRGDPTYDPTQHLLNFPDRLAADAVGFAERMADLLELDAERLRLWLFARCVLESVDQPDLHAVARELAP